MEAQQASKPRISKAIHEEIHYLGFRFFGTFYVNSAKTGAFKIGTVEAHLPAFMSYLLAITYNELKGSIPDISCYSREHY